jgi:hypothetical protein
MNIGKILVYQNNSDHDLNTIKEYVSAKEITEVGWIIKYIDQGYISVQSNRYLQGYSVYQVDDSAKSKFLSYTGDVVGALEFDEQSFMDFVLCNQLILVNDFIIDMEDVMERFLSVFNNYWYVKESYDLIEELQVKLVNLFYTPYLMEDPMLKRIPDHLSNKW